MRQLSVAIVDTLDGIPAIRCKDSHGKLFTMQLSPQSKPRAQKLAKAMLAGRVSPTAWLIRKHGRRIAALERDRIVAPLTRLPRSKIALRDYIDSIIAANNLEVDWLREQKAVLTDRRRQR
jgi:hypothetical protein